MIQFFRLPLLVLPLAALLAVAIPSRRARSQVPPDQPAADSSPAVSVQLRSGRTFTGRISNRSTDRLVLLKERGTIKIWRPIAWWEIAAVTIDGEAADIERLRDLALEAALRRGDESQFSLPQAIAPEEQPVTTEVTSRLIPAVTTITFDAFVANWDGDVETDGLVVLLAPLDADGGLAAVSGTVEVEFFAPQRRTFHHAPQSGGDTLERVERWTLQVQDYGPRGARLRLPFGAIHPELDQDWPANHYGLVHVRFSAAGHGVFEDSRDGVRIRPWSPNRDQLEMNTGRRFLPTEGLGRHD